MKLLYPRDLNFHSRDGKHRQSILQLNANKQNSFTYFEITSKIGMLRPERVSRNQSCANFINCICHCNYHCSHTGCSDDTNVIEGKCNSFNVRHLDVFRLPAKLAGRSTRQWKLKIIKVPNSSLLLFWITRTFENSGCSKVLIS